MSKISPLDPFIIPAIVVLAFVVISAAVLLIMLTRRDRRSKVAQVKPVSRQTVKLAPNPVSTPEAAQPELFLVTNSGKIYSLDKLPVKVGRGTECEIVLEDDTVSTGHARIFLDPETEAVMIEDLNSVNGVYVNGSPTRKNFLSQGDRLTFGSTSLTFQRKGEAHPSSSKEQTRSQL